MAEGSNPLVRGERRCAVGVDEHGNIFAQYVRADWADAEIERLQQVVLSMNALMPENERLRAALEGAETWRDYYRAKWLGQQAVPERPAPETTARCPVTWQPVIGGPAVPCTLPVGHNGKHLAPEPFAAKTEGSQT